MCSASMSAPGLCSKPVSHPPNLCPLRTHPKKQTLTVKQLLRLVRSLRRPTFRVGQCVDRHDAYTPNFPYLQKYQHGAHGQPLRTAETRGKKVGILEGKQEKTRAVVGLRGLILEEREGFEPSMGFNPHTPLAGEHLRPLGHRSEATDYASTPWLSGRECSKIRHSEIESAG